MSCLCKNIIQQSAECYAQQVVLIPFWRTKPVCIDPCLYNEIISLWDKRIETTGCCCGHNTKEGFIGVIFSDIVKMKKLGYKVHFNVCRPKDEDSFIPLSV